MKDRMLDLESVLYFDNAIIFLNVFVFSSLLSKRWKEMNHYLWKQQN